MNIFERYISKIILSAIFLVFISLLFLFAFISLVQVSKLVGQGNFEFVDSLYYILLTTPQIAYDIFPFSTLLGSLIGLNYLNSHSEITAIRCSGFSNQKIIFSIIKTCIPLSLLVFLIGEFIAPESGRMAHNSKQEAIHASVSLSIKNEVWIKNNNYFANIKSIQSDNILNGITIYTYNSQKKLNKVTFAQQAVYHEPHWILKSVHQTKLFPNRLDTSVHEELLWESPLDLGLIEIITTEIYRLSAYELYKYAQYLDANNLDSSIYYLNFWQKIIAPFTLFAMLLIAYPFAATNTRSKNMGTLLVIGIIIGISFNILNKISAEFGLLYNLSPFISASTFTLITFILSIFLTKKLT